MRRCRYTGTGQRSPSHMRRRRKTPTAHISPIAGCYPYRNIYDIDCNCICEPVLLLKCSDCRFYCCFLFFSQRLYSCQRHRKECPSHCLICDCHYHRKRWLDHLYKLWVKEQLPLLELRKIRIPLSKKQLPSFIGGLAGGKGEEETGEAQ